jgi:hypothetical protein
MYGVYEDHIARLLLRPHGRKQPTYRQKDLLRDELGERD